MLTRSSQYTHIFLSKTSLVLSFTLENSPSNIHYQEDMSSHEVIHLRRNSFGNLRLTSIGEKKKKKKECTPLLASKSVLIKTV